MAFDPAFLEELRARLPISAVVARRTKLVRSGRNFKACCPFHGEKTPSFYIYDDHFHCFGCGAHGDVISFVMQAEGRSFPEAVEQLAGEAGLEVPRQTERERDHQREVRTLSEVLQAVQASWVRRLHSPEGRNGLAYLRGRGLSDETIHDFGLGWSGDGRGGLLSELAAVNITAEHLMHAGVMRVDETGKPKGELFFNRVTFPIYDRRGGLVSFGGRILGDGQPKYLNGPETALFSKRRTLFGLDRAHKARRSPRESGGGVPDLIVVEGYMDVIALHQAGFQGAVAPLGTALTAEQLQTLWRTAPDPVLCFDGDAAGSRAAVRAAEVALPLLSVENTIRFCVLPEGDDPDSVVRDRGRGAMAEIVASARPIGERLFDLLSADMPASPGPEARASLRHKLLEAAGRIDDKQLAAEYRSTLLDRFFQAYRKTPARFEGKSGSRSAGLRPQIIGISRSAFTLDAATNERLRLLTALLLLHPQILGAVEEAYCRLELPEDLHVLREAILDHAGDADVDAEGLRQALISAGFGQEYDAFVRDPRLPFQSRQADELMLVSPEQSWWHYYAILNLPQFRNEVRTDLQRVGEMNATEWGRLQARLLALEALSRVEIEE